jgi:Domain of unknown function(DUF2779)
MWPYSQIPFQWSVHRQVAPGAQLEHFEYLADNDQDPRRDFIESLCAVLGTRGPIIVYNVSFESCGLRELADRLPDYKDRIENLQERLWDLLPFVRQHVYHPQFNGSLSIKSVLPALVPELTYDGMDVSHGAAAGVAWERMVKGVLCAEEREGLKTALLAYCRQDTLAMVKILERLQALTCKTGASALPVERAVKLHM